MNNQRNILPEGISMEDQGATTIIRYRWYSNFYIPLMVFCVVWDSALIYEFIQTIGNHGPDMWRLAVYAIPCALIGLLLSYFLLAIIVNESIIELGNNELRLIHTPLPWRGNQQISILDLQRVACEPSGTQRAYYTNVVLHFNNGARKLLFWRIPNKATAQFICNQIRDFRTNTLGSKSIGGFQHG